MTVVRLLIWNVADSKTTLDELRAQLPPPGADVHWLANEVQERFGVIVLGDELPDLTRVRALLGTEPAVAEEFDSFD